MTIKLGPGREFERIRAMAARWKDRARGIGDDCAFIESGGERLAVSIDCSLEDVHFRRAWLTPAEIGYRAAAAALSDLAAVAASPMALLLTLGVTRSDGDDVVLAIADGVGDAVSDAGAVIVGGDLVASDKLLLDCCVIGRAGHDLTRRGAKPGDRLVVTGQLGGPLAALTAWQAGREAVPEARWRFARPAQRHDAARFLAGRRARAMIDISDGLAGDLRQLLAASGVGARVDTAGIPVLPAAREAARKAGEAPWRFAARSGEEYELLAALPNDIGEAELAASPVPLSVIGEIEEQPGVRAIEDGKDAGWPTGHDHFAA